jgi:hypothetical protein
MASGEPYHPFVWGFCVTLGVICALVVGCFTIGIWLRVFHVI